MPPPDEPEPQGQPPVHGPASPTGKDSWPIAERPATGEIPIVLTPARPPRSGLRRRWLDAILGAEEAAEFRSISARVCARIDGVVHRSQPFAASLCVHALALIVLALVFVRVSRDRRRPIDLSFATATAVEADRPGLQMVVRQPELEPEPEPEALTEQEPVPEPMAAPEAKEAEAVEALGAAPVPAAAPAVGSLLDGREAGRREKLVAAHGGSEATEAAVARALAWLVRQQAKDGLWSLQGPYLDHASQENKVAATAMALLALQGAGNTTRAGLHRDAVTTAWKALLKRQAVARDATGDEGRRRSGAGTFLISPQDPPARQALYAHAQATIALCELYGMTKDPAFEEPARRAVAYAVAAQGRNGGWRYEPGQNGDMSVTGWFMMALKSAQMAGIDVPEATFAGLSRFLDGAAVDQGSRYGYRFDDIPPAGDAGAARFVRKEAGPVTEAVSAEGLLCRQFLGWPRGHPQLVRGVDLLLTRKFLDWDSGKDVYAWYYITQVVHHLGGPAWARWNSRMREVLPEKQVSRGSEAGSWDPAGDQWGPWGGRLFTTCFCTSMLEVYYRHLPLYGEEVVAAAP